MLQERRFDGKRKTLIISRPRAAHSSHPAATTAFINPRRVPYHPLLLVVL
jgi:hypothetical protein